MQISGPPRSVLPGTMVIDETASMDASHRRAAQAIAPDSGIAVLQRNGTLRPGRGARARPLASAAKRIADAIVARIRNPPGAQSPATRSAAN